MLFFSLGSTSCINSHVALDLPLKKSLDITEDHVLACLHHSVGLSDTQVHTSCINRLLALRCALIFTSQFEVLLEERN